MQEKQAADIRKRLCGKKILVLGPESDTKRKFLQAFRNDAFEISGNAEDMSAENYVILFGFSDQTFHAGGWEMFSSLMCILRRIEAVHPESVLFVSRSDVYGKIFGEFYPVKEDEIGYVCHTSAQDQEAARLRMLENLCFRMAREDGIAVKIARFPDIRADGGEYDWKNAKAGAEQNAVTGSGERAEYKQQSANRSRKRRNTADSRTAYQDWKRIASLTAEILLDGAAGEAYNADGVLWARPERELQPVQDSAADSGGKSGSDSADIFESDLTLFADTTALEPIRIVMDTGKAGKLG